MEVTGRQPKVGRVHDQQIGLDLGFANADYRKTILNFSNDDASASR
jgi:hypothetical protein